MISSVPNLRDVVLLGGGHSHALLIRRWGMRPLAGVRLTLISQDVLTPYSGMLPGFIAGHYSHDDIHIDLSRLCRWAGVRFIEATVTGLDLEQKQVTLADRVSMEYDVLSIDTGSTPNTHQVVGAKEHAISVKPIHQLQNRWLDFCERLKQAPIATQTRQHIAVVGAGVGGFELLIALDRALRERGVDYCMHWILRSDAPLKSRPPKAQQLALNDCAKKNIQVHTGFDVKEVTAAGLHAHDARFLPLDEVFWCAAAAAPAWPAEAGLSVNEGGFISTNRYLQSVSHSHVFASGDVATQLETPTPKAGVFAVRQAPVLFENLRRFVLGQALRSYKPQRNTLCLMDLGNKSAIATRGSFTFMGKWAWHWKDSIDRKFMDQFAQLPKLEMRTSGAIGKLHASLKAEAATVDTAMRCGGCGAKVPANVLLEVLSQLQPTQRPDVLQGVAALGDAAIVDCAGKHLAQSVDQFRAMLDDPYVFGRIAALHALSDLFAVGAEAQSALALVTLPHAAEALSRRDLLQLMSGALFELNRHDCSLVGGHTSEAAEMSLGFVVNGLLEAPPVSSPSPQIGHRLILSKGLGTGIVLSADMHARARGVDMRETIKSMLQSNSAAVPVLFPHASAITDVTGFGLLGHLLNLSSDAGIGFELDLNAIPTLASSLSLAIAGEQSTLAPANSRFLLSTEAADVSLSALTVLCDPQTSGGLLACVPAELAAQCCAQLSQLGYDRASVIGGVIAVEPGAKRVSLQGGLQA